MAAETRSVVVRLTAENAQYIREMQHSGKVTVEEMGKAAKSVDKTGAALDDLGGKAGKIGLAAAGGLAAIGKAAIDWESQWAGVTKTVDGTGAELRELEGDLRNLATSLPATHEEIAGVAEAAGQLGVKREDIADFTKTMVDLGETTNLTAEDAATSIAQIANVMGTTGDEVDNFGATLVALGNDGASTEKQILDMTQRIAGAGAQIGLAEGEILAIANAAASMGIEAEAGGSAISRVFTELAKATKTQGPNLANFAKVAGVSAQAFTEAFESDPARAFASFTEGLNRINKSGGDVFTTLDQLGLSDIRVSQALLSMAASGDLLTDGLDLQATAWTENTALTEEAEKRYATTAAQVQIAWNKIKDAGIEAGAALLPVIANIAEVVGTLANVFGDLPDPVQSSLTGLLAITAVVGGGLWFTARVTTGIVNTRAQLRLLATEGTRTAAVLNRVGMAAGGIGKFKAAALLGGIAVASTGAADGIGLTNTASLAMMGTIAGPWGAAIGGGIGLVMDLADNQRILAQATDDATRAIESQDLSVMTRELDELDKKFDEMRDFDLGTIASSLKAAPGLFAGFLSGKSIDEMQANSPAAQLEEQRDRILQAMSDLRNEALANNTGSIDSVLLGPLKGLASQASITADALDEVADRFEHMNSVLSGRASLRDYRAALRGINEALEQNGRGLNTWTEAGSQNQAALDSIAASAVKVAEGMQGTEQVRFLAQARKDFIEARVALRGVGESSEDARRKARLLADEIGLVDKKNANPKIDANTNPALKKLQELDPLLHGLDDRTVVPNVDADTKRGREELAAMDPILNGLDSWVARPLVDVDTAGARSELTGFQQAINALTGTTVYVSTKTVAPTRPVITAADPKQALGGFYPHHYATGGIDVANGHQPEIAPAGAWRVWAEPETQGETYIPHANDHRRPAAKRYLEQTANIFGGSVQWYATGGVRQQTFTRQAPSVAAGPQVMQVTGNLQTPWGPAVIEGIARAAARNEIADSAALSATSARMHRGGGGE